MSRSSSSADVIVVGAGPAGAAAALLLARLGHDVLLLDRHEFPRAKACGDCLSPEASPVLDRLGVLAQVEARAPAHLDGWRIVAPGGREFTASFAAAAGGDARVARGIALERSRLDLVLVDAAVLAGARLLTLGRVTDIARGERGAVAGVAGRMLDGEPFRLGARLVLGADGLRSIVARRLGLLRRAPRLRKLSLTAHARGIKASVTGEMHLGDGCCAGLAPVEACSPARPAQGAAPGPSARPGPAFNLTLVVDARRYGRDVARDPESFFWTAVRSFPGLRGRLDQTALTAPLLASGPFDWPTREVVAEGAALVGDAAGYYDPFTGQGIYQALACAELLAEEADAALRAGDVSAARLRRYAVRHRDLVRGPRRLQHLIEGITSRPRLARAAIARLASRPAMAQALIAATGDLLPPVSLLSPRLLLSFLAPWPAPEAAV